MKKILLIASIFVMLLFLVACSTKTISGDAKKGLALNSKDAAHVSLMKKAVINITANVTGNYTGNYTGNMTGNYTGNYTGNMTGNYTGNYTGNMTGNFTDVNISLNKSRKLR